MNEELDELAPILRYLYSQEQNVQIESLWDGGWYFSLGDTANCFKAVDGPYYDLDEGARWLLKTFRRLVE